MTFWVGVALFIHAGLLESMFGLEGSRTMHGAKTIRSWIVTLMGLAGLFLMLGAYFIK